MNSPSATPNSPVVVRVSSPDAESVEARVYLAPQARAALLFGPAMGVPAKSYEAFSTTLAARGVTVMVADLRGVGTSTTRPRRGVDFGYGELLEDQDALWAELSRQSAGARIHLGGHSLGGQLALLQLARKPRPHAKLVLVACGTTYFGAWRFPRNIGVLVGTSLAGAVAKGLGYFPGHRLGFGGLQPARLIGEWASVGRKGRYHSSTRGDLEAGLAEVTNEVLAVNVEGDELAPQKSTRLLLNKTPAARVREAVASKPESPKSLSSHFTWMRSPDQVAELIASFLLEDSTPS